jgi:hypothetical protein
MRTSPLDGKAVKDWTVEDFDRATLHDVVSRPISEWEEAARDTLKKLEASRIWSPPASEENSDPSGRPTEADRDIAELRDEMLADPLWEDLEPALRVHLLDQVEAAWRDPT